jgi:tetratricopeptide (TPR) repeat protein
MLLDKPVVLFNNPMQKNYSQYDPNDIEYRVRDAGIQVGSVEEMKLAVKLSLADPGEYSSRRKSYADTLNYKIDGKCAQRAAQAIMQILTSDEKQTEDNVLFSIIVFWDHVPSQEEISTTIREIKEKNKGILYEIIFVGLKPSQEHTLPEIKAWVEDYSFTGTSLNRAVEMATGNFIVFLRPNTAMPKSCLKWMYHYFKWHSDAGAVKAISLGDNYKEILNEVPEDQRPTSLPDIADYFLHVLMGNDVKADYIEKENECLMISKKTYEQVGGLAVEPLNPDPIKEFGMKLKANGYTLWNAVDVFVYPLEQKSNNVDILNLVAQAQKHKKEKNYKEAIALLEKAKTLVGTSKEENRQGKIEKGLSLLEESRAYKKKKEYKKSIELLEEAKEKIA